MPPKMNDSTTDVVDEGDLDSTDTPEGTDDQVDAAAGETAPPPANAGAPKGRTIVMPSDSLGRIKREERERGARAMRADLAKQYGFASVEAMDAFMKGQQAGTAAAPKAPQAPKAEPSGDPGPAPAGLSAAATAAWETERANLLREAETQRRRAAHNEKKYQQARRTIEDRETELELQRSAFSVGIKDPDYAIRLLNRHVANKSEEELAGFDEVKFFEGLKQSHDYLFRKEGSSQPQGTVLPASTGTVAEDVPPPAPKPGEVNKDVGTQIDAKKMTQKEFADHMRARGLNPSL